MNKRILFVAMQNSPHTARWLELLADKGWDLHLFAINSLDPLPQLKGVTVHRPWIRLTPRKYVKDILMGASDKSKSVCIDDNRMGLQTAAIYPFPVFARWERILGGAFKVSLGESKTAAPFFYGPRPLAKLIKKLKPDLIHSMEFQHCGYRVLEAKSMVGKGFPPWLATNWGSDIYYYQRFDDHKKQIIRLLENADYYSCECRRDVRLARSLGFAGKVLPVLTNTGGFDLETVGRLRKATMPSGRRLIMVKGYQHFAGRALTALDALEQCRNYLSGYTIVVYAASKEVVDRVEELRRFGTLDIELLSYCDHEAMLRMYSRARIYLGVSISDAISTSLLESMALGAFPIQTDTSCCDEWIQDGLGGFIVPVDNVGIIADRIKRALSDDELVDTAYSINWSVVKNRLDSNMLRDKVSDFYAEIFG